MDVRQFRGFSSTVAIKLATIVLGVLHMLSVSILNFEKAKLVVAASRDSSRLRKQAVSVEGDLPVVEDGSTDEMITDHWLSQCLKSERPTRQRSPPPSADVYAASPAMASPTSHIHHHISTQTTV